MAEVVGSTPIVSTRNCQERITKVIRSFCVSGRTPVGQVANEARLEAYDSCRLCPRACGAARNDGARGACGANATLKVARAALHFWEEPPISGEAGSGAVFFSGCPLKCVFCQNREISAGNFGHEVSVSRLAEIMLELQAQGALNINLVTPLHFAPQVREAVLAARSAGLSLPCVCNTSGYELASTVRLMSDVVDVWLTDFKYASDELAGRLSGARDYPTVASSALEAMLASVRAAGGPAHGDDGRMLRGIIVRHLVLPGHTDDSCAVLDRVWELAGNEVEISVMNQYTPNAVCRRRGGDLARAVTDEEYERILDHADDLGFETMWWQQGGTVSESFVPAFDATGVDGPELG